MFGSAKQNFVPLKVQIEILQTVSLSLIRLFTVDLILLLAMEIRIQEGHHAEVSAECAPTAAPLWDEPKEKLTHPEGAASHWGAPAETNLRKGDEGLKP